MFLEQTVLSKVCCVASGGEDDRSVFRLLHVSPRGSAEAHLLTIVLILDTDDPVSVLQKVRDFGLLQDCKVDQPHEAQFDITHS